VGQLGPRDYLQQAISEIWEEVLPIREIDVRTSFLAAAGDPGLTEAMLRRVEALLGVRVPLVSFLADPTVEGLAAAVEAARGLGLPPAYEAFEPAVVDGAASARPFFYISDESAYQLARDLGSSLPTYVMRYVAEGRPRMVSIEETAAACLATIRRRQPEGPYRLGGYCFGAVVAFEMARQLERAGATVEPLILVAPRPWTHRWFTRPRLQLVARLLGWSAEREIAIFARLTDLIPRWENRVSALLRRGVHWLRRPLRDKVAVVARKLRRARARGAGEVPAQAPAPSAAVIARRKRQRESFAITKRVNRAYMLAPLAGPLTILWPEHEPVTGPGYPDHMWRPVVEGGVSLQIVPGGHLTCLSRHVTELAERLRLCLGVPQAGSATSRSDSQRAARPPATAAASVTTSASTVTGMPGAMAARDGRDGSRQASTANSVPA